MNSYVMVAADVATAIWHDVSTAHYYYYY